MTERNIEMGKDSLQMPTSFLDVVSHDVCIRRLGEAWL